MRRLLQIVAIVLAVWLCVTMVRPFLTEVELEWGKNQMNMAVKASEAARKAKQPVTTALRLLSDAERFFQTAKRVTLGDGQVWLFLAHVTSLAPELDRTMSNERRRSMQRDVVQIVDEAQSFYVDNNMILRRALAYAALGDSMKAIQDLETTLYYYAMWSQATRPIVHIYMQEITRRDKKEPKRIMRAMERLADRFPKDRDTALQLGKAYLSQKQSEMARMRLRQAEGSGKGDLELGTLIAQSYVQEGDFRMAAWELCRALHFSSTKKSKDLAPVIRALKGLLERDPENADGHFIMGTVQQDRLADLSAARRDYLNAYKVRRAHFETIKRLTEVCEGLGDAEEAMKWRATADKILEFSKRIQLDLPSGARRDAYCLFVAEANELSPLLGEVVKDDKASGGQAVLLSKSKGRTVPIMLRCPPLPAGDYEMSVRMKVMDTVKDPATALAKIRVDGDSVQRIGSKRRAKSVCGRDLTPAGEYRDVTLRFYHPGLVDFELRVEYLAVSDLYIDRVAVGFMQD
ncbi:MAG: hypothetical protein JW759_08755 [Candidatus Coatesbacteria bacterium]|nr:hypothetical protein [Candidatus Coatesbacteria bacterium]